MKVPLNELSGVAHEVLEMSYSAKASKEKATIVALRGELGSGKTTFVQALAGALGVKEMVQSPTYVLMKKYAIPQGDTFKASPFRTLVHIDAYRLDKPQEFAALRPEQFLNDPVSLVVVEWPEKLGTLLPTPDLTINFSSKDAEEGERYIEMV